jgi:hypothetical protein
VERREKDRRDGEVGERCGDTNPVLFCEEASTDRHCCCLSLSLFLSLSPNTELERQALHAMFSSGAHLGVDVLTVAADILTTECVVRPSLGRTMCSVCFFFCSTGESACLICV